MGSLFIALWYLIFVITLGVFLNHCLYLHIGNKTGKNALFFLIVFLLSRNQETNQENHTSETMNHTQKRGRLI